MYKRQDTVRPAVGAGKERDYFQSLDQQQGFDPATNGYTTVSYTHLRAHETVLDLVCRLLLEKKKRHKQKVMNNN